MINKAQNMERNMSLGVKLPANIMIDFLVRDHEFSLDLPSPRCNLICIFDMDF